MLKIQNKSQWFKKIAFATLAVSILNACGGNEVVKTKLSFLDSLGEHKVNYSEEEKIERIIAFYKKKLANVKDLEVKFLEKISANKDLEFDAFIFEFNINGESQQEILFIKDNFFFSDFASIESLNTSKQKIVKRLEEKANEKILENLKEDFEYVVTLGSGNKEIYVFTDPLCPFCREHLKSINEKFLAKHKVHFVFVSVHQDAGFNRASLIYENIENAKDDKEKLDIIKLYYGDNINQEFVSPQRSFNIKMLYDKYIDLGVKYVPYIIEVK
ncbi:thiol peroxidase [Helicobacter labetoulli]|uniref:thiol peroxidase n=1 Tax=Helicobacter labetoulli TaxID=2315333 RepID=UPI000EF721DC|nr:thiol peroxidase [Helicobacter labetoulli]